MKVRRVARAFLPASRYTKFFVYGMRLTPYAGANESNSSGYELCVRPGQ